MENRDVMYGRNDLLETGYTVEYHLKMYAESENATERHKVLWYAWNQNKRWIAQLLEWTLSSFPTYSYHNSTHADTVLHNIERILGGKSDTTTVGIRLLCATAYSVHA